MSYEVKAKRVLYPKCFRSSWRTHQNYNKATAHIRKISRISWRMRWLRGILLMCINPEGRVWRGQSPALFLWCSVTEQDALGTTWTTGRSLWTSGNTFSYCEGAWELTQVAQRGCRISILGDFQKPSGHDPGQLALDDSAWAGEVWSRWPSEVPFNLSNSVIVISNVNLCSQDSSTQKDGMEPMPNTWHFCYLVWISLFGFFENPAKTIFSYFSSKSSFPVLPKENEQRTY